MSEQIKHEPSADMRAVAKAMRGLYVALMDEGFSQDEALKIIAVMLAAAPKENES